MAENKTDKRLKMRTRKSRAQNLRMIRVFIFAICLVLAFVVGFTLRGNTPFLASLGFSPSITGIDADTAATAGAPEKTVYNSLSSRISEVEDVLENDSLNSYELNEATRITLDAFLASSDDKYLRYYTEERYQALLNSSTSSYAGIGVLFSEYEGQAYAVDVFEGSSAQLAGIEEGDFVVAIDGDRSQGWSRSEVTAALNREEGESAIVTWRRPESFGADGGSEFTTTLVCSTYNIENVTTELHSGLVGYISVHQLTQNSAELVNQAVKELDVQGAGAYVLDLRDNPGGFLTQAVDIASVFMPSGTVVQVQTGDNLSAKSTKGNPVTDKPLVVLINGNTAAGCEALAAALQESDRATLVGEHTLGKGSVQVVHELSFGGAIRYTAAYYLTPKGTLIDGIGVSPDVNVSYGDNDAQKSYAIGAALAMAVG